MKKFINNYNHKILITGCGCSGTQFIAQFLSKAGLPFGHDRLMGKYGISSWALAAQTDDVSWGPKYSSYKFKPILHQVRFPLNCITSIGQHETTFGHPSWQFIENNISIEENDSLLIKSMKYWLFWNQKAEKMSSWTYRLEDLEQNLEKLFKELGCEFDAASQDPIVARRRTALRRLKIFKSMPKNIGTRWKKKVKKTLTWDDLYQEDASLTEKIKNQAKQYGYEI